MAAAHLRWLPANETPLEGEGTLADADGSDHPSKGLTRSVQVDSFMSTRALLVELPACQPSKHGKRVPYARVARVVLDATLCRCQFGLCLGKDPVFTHRVWLSTFSRRKFSWTQSVRRRRHPSCVTANLSGTWT